MITLNTIKIIFAVISFLTIATWYVFCWLCKKYKRFETPTLVLTFVMAVIAVLVCMGVALEA